MRPCSSADVSTTRRYEPEGGLRSRDFNEYSGSLGLLLKPQAANDNVVVALNLASASRYPALEELYYFGPHPGNLAFEVGNADLDAEHALGFDVSLRGTRPPVRRRSSPTSATTSRTTSSDSPPERSKTNSQWCENVAADSVLSGIEAHADVRLTNELTAEVTYDWVQGELKSRRSAASHPAVPCSRRPHVSEECVPGRRQRAGRCGSESRLWRGTSDSWLHHGEVLRRLFLHARRRTQYRYGAIGQRHRQAVSQSSELPERRPAGDRAQLQGGVFGGVLMNTTTEHRSTE